MHVLDVTIASLHTIAGGTAKSVEWRATLCAMYDLMITEASEACHLVALHSAGDAPPEDHTCGHSVAESAMHLYLQLCLRPVCHSSASLKGNGYVQQRALGRLALMFGI